MLQKLQLFLLLFIKSKFIRKGNRSRNTFIKQIFIGHIAFLILVTDSFYVCLSYFSNY